MPSGLNNEGQSTGSTGADPARGVIVVGASAGGIEALRTVVGGLPAELPAAVVVVVHIPPHVRSVLPAMLARTGPLPADHARDGDPLLPGRVYVAPPDRHLLVEPGRVRLSSGPRENHSRPAVDPSLRSAALAYGPRVVGVVLSGALSDGTAGLWEVKQKGGMALVQDPGEAAYPSMPHSAMDQVPVDYVLPAAQMGEVLSDLVQSWELNWGLEEGGPQDMSAEEKQDEKPGSEAVDRDTAAQVEGARDGAVTVYVCPDCGGTLWQVNAGRFLRFRCHVGHVYAGEDLLEGYTADMERSLWYVVRSLRDKANLTRQLANAARDRGDADKAAAYEEKARLDDEYSAAIERMIADTTAANRGR